MTAASIPGEFVALAWRLKQNSTVMFNPQILAASWVEKMVSLYSPVVEEWVAIPDKHPKLKILKELDRFIEGTMEKMQGLDKTNPDLWGETMKLVLEEEFGEPTELDQRELDLNDRLYLQTLREHLNAIVNHYFEADWEKEVEGEQSGE